MFSEVVTYIRVCSRKCTIQIKSGATHPYGMHNISWTKDINSMNGIDALYVLVLFLSVMFLILAKDCTT